MRHEGKGDSTSTLESGMEEHGVQREVGSPELRVP